MLGTRVFSNTFGYSMPPADLSAYLASSISPASISSEILSSTNTLIVAFPPSSPSTIIGYAQLRRDSFEPCIAGSPKPVELLRLYVDEGHHGKGIARGLVEKIEGMAREEGYQTIWLGVWEENFKAQGVYGKFGYKRVGDHAFVMGECVQTDWIMSKSL